ncbi:MAG: zf-HC2 domain-containing protein [Deltaproteobacteria bacterium]|nr:zf-HC2 domain-containing protein [Deltaproteobacteria bacterium]
MKLRAEEASQLYRESTRSSQPPGDRCLADDRLEALLAGQLSDKDRRSVAEHLARCSDCSSRYQALSRNPAKAGDPGRFSRSSPGLKRWWPLAAAIVLTAGAGLVINLTQPPTPLEDVLRSGRSFGAAVKPADGAVLSAAPGRFEWREEGEPRRYRLQLYGEKPGTRVPGTTEETPLWESPWLETPTAELPPSLRQELAKGGIFHWRISTENTDSTENIDSTENTGAPPISPLFRLEIIPPKPRLPPQSQFP